jgi:hypothetical protein
MTAPQASRAWAALGALLVLTLVLLPIEWITPNASGLSAWAGPVNWQEVPATEAGRQWWDQGSLRRDRRGTLSVLSRYQAADAGEKALGTLVVMDLDCLDGLVRDRSVNGLPQWQATWFSVAADPLAQAVLQQACAAAGSPLPTGQSPSLAG